MELSIVMPCLNEAETLETCIAKAKQSLERLGVEGEVIVADNGSTDGSQDLARKAGARVVSVERKGYGSALMGGIEASEGTYVIMGDADDSYDFTNLSPFLETLREGFDLVMGNRFKGGIEKGAMPFLHRYLGNPVLSAIGRLFFRTPIGDFHCGLRGFSKSAYARMDLHTTGMEFASEMIVKASLNKLKIAEVPTTLSPDGRNRPPHLRTWRDGWRHLRFMLLYSPRWLFLYPGFLLLVSGIIGTLWLLGGPRTLANVHFDIHTMLYCAVAILVGFQAVSFAFVTKTFAVTTGLLPEDRKFRRLFDRFNLEIGLVTGVVLSLIGIVASIAAVAIWGGEKAFGPLDPAKMLRLVIPASLMIVLGFQVTLTSFLLSAIGLRRKENAFP